MRKWLTGAILIGSAIVAGLILIVWNESQQETILTPIGSENLDENSVQNPTPQQPSISNYFSSEDKPSGWSIVDSISYDFDGDNVPHQITLFKSNIPMGTGGAGQKLYGVRLHITKDDEIAYQYEPKYSASSRDNFFSSSMLLLQDVTNDGLPEIIFTDGFQFASDYLSQLRILGYDPQTRSISEHQAKDFTNSGLERTQLVQSHTSISILVTKGDWLESEGHYGQHYYYYTLYSWSASNNEFIVVDKTRSAAKFDDPEEAVADWMKQHRAWKFIP